MSQIGNVDKVYGQQVNIGSANVSGSILLNSVNLPKNAIIISSPIDDEGNDTGTYTLIATDTDGNPVRLTYTIQAGNGLNINGDIINLNIDDETIIDNDGKLSVNSDNIIDNSTLISRNNLIYVDTSKLTKADNENYGIVIPNNSNVISNDGVLSVNTQSLEKSNDSLDQIGLCIGDQETTSTKNGYISVITDGLDKANYNSKGIVKPDNYYISSNNGILHYNYEAIPSSTTSSRGIVKIDNKTVINKNSSLVVSDSLAYATNSSFGIINIDNNSLEFNSYGQLSVKNYNKVLTYISTFNKDLKNIETNVDTYSYLVEGLSLVKMGPTIFAFSAQSIPSVSLKKSKSTTSIEHMTNQHTSIEFKINTNCNFNISVDFEDNINPSTELYEINYNNTDKYKGVIGLNKEYQSTEGKNNKIQFIFTSKNYKNSDTTNYSTITKAKIRISAVTDATVYKEVIYSIVRYNANYESVIKDKVKDTTTSNQTVTVIDNESITPFAYTFINSYYFSGQYVKFRDWYEYNSSNFVYFSNTESRNITIDNLGTQKIITLTDVIDYRVNNSPSDFSKVLSYTYITYYEGFNNIYLSSYSFEYKNNYTYGKYLLSIPNPSYVDNTNYNVTISSYCASLNEIPSPTVLIDNKDTKTVKIENYINGAVIKYYYNSSTNKIFTNVIKKIILTNTGSNIYSNSIVVDSSYYYYIWAEYQDKYSNLLVYKPQIENNVLTSFELINTIPIVINGIGQTFKFINNIPTQLLGDVSKVVIKLNGEFVNDMTGILYNPSCTNMFSDNTTIKEINVNEDSKPRSLVTIQDEKNNIITTDADITILILKSNINIGKSAKLNLTNNTIECELSTSITHNDNVQISLQISE